MYGPKRCFYIEIEFYIAITQWIKLKFLIPNRIPRYRFNIHSNGFKAL